MTRQVTLLLPCLLVAAGASAPAPAEALVLALPHAAAASAPSLRMMPPAMLLQATPQTPPAPKPTPKPTTPPPSTKKPAPGAQAPAAPAAPGAPAPGKAPGTPAAPVAAEAGGPAGENVAPAALTAAIDKLGSLDFPIRTQASRTVRRAAAAQAVPALSQAVAAHKDGYVRFRALVLLAGFSAKDARAPMEAAFEDKNDRLREVAYAYFEQHPDPALATKLLAKLETEESEFVRPALVRALAALGTDPKVQQIMLREVNRGQDFFRSSVIEALGAHKASYAIAPLVTIAKQDGPLQEDAVIALGRIGDKKALETIAPLQRAAPRARQPALASAICLLGVNCESHERFLLETIKFSVANPGFQDLIRSTARGLSYLAVNGRATAWTMLLEQGGPSVDPARAPIALALASAAVQQPDAFLAALQTSADQKAALSLLRDGFDMLEEDYGEEQFYVAIRRAYWKLPADGAERKTTETLITTLEF